MPLRQGLRWPPMAAALRAVAQVLVLVLTAAMIGGSVGAGAERTVFTQYLKQCAPGCEEIGNCNGETGQCDCPFGLAGGCVHGVPPTGRRHAQHAPWW